MSVGSSKQLVGEEGEGGGREEEEKGDIVERGIEVKKEESQLQVIESRYMDRDLRREV